MITFVGAYFKVNNVELTLHDFFILKLCNHHTKKEVNYVYT